MDEDKGTVLDALADAAIEATEEALKAAKSGRHTDADQLINFTNRLTYQIFTIEDHNNSANRSGSPKTAITTPMMASGSLG